MRLSDSSCVHIVLLEPRIPHNTGAIGRLCVGGGCVLHVIHPLGFSLSAKEIRRAGLDYWEFLKLYEWADLESFWKAYPPNHKHYFLSTKGLKAYYHACFEGEVFLYFGREDKGLPESLLADFKDQCLSIPMRKEARSLNLATAVAIVMYEALRQGELILDKGSGL